MSVSQKGPRKQVEVGDTAPDPQVLDTSGREIPLSRFWADRPAILAFLRHFG